MERRENLKTGKLYSNKLILDSSGRVVRDLMVVACGSLKQLGNLERWLSALTSQTKASRALQQVLLSHMYIT
jgi:hypothetical protein